MLRGSDERSGRDPARFAVLAALELPSQHLSSLQRSTLLVVNLRFLNSKPTGRDFPATILLLTFPTAARDGSGRLARPHRKPDRQTNKQTGKDGASFRIMSSLTKVSGLRSSISRVTKPPSRPVNPLIGWKRIHACNSILSKRPFICLLTLALLVETTSAQTPLLRGAASTTQSRTSSRGFVPRHERVAALPRTHRSDSGLGAPRCHREQPAAFVAQFDSGNRLGRTGG